MAYEPLEGALPSRDGSAKRIALERLSPRTAAAEEAEAGPKSDRNIDWGDVAEWLKAAVC
jgi:hypothetical protein